MPKDFELSSACYLHTDDDPALLSISGLVRDTSGQMVESGDKAELYRAFKAAQSAGELFKLSMTIIPHRNGMSNKNFWMVDPKYYRAIMATGVNAPFIRDHAVYEGTEARGGKIISSKTKGAGDDEQYLVQEVELSKPWAIEDALTGNMDRFSIQLNRENVYCSICGQRVWENNRLVWDGCHFPGYTYDIEGKGKVVAWWIAGKGTTFMETSTVINPAVSGTGIEQIKQLAASCGLTETLPLEEELMNPEELKASLASKEEELKAKDLELSTVSKAAEDLKTAVVEAKEAAKASALVAMSTVKRMCSDLVAQIGQVRSVSADLLSGCDSVVISNASDDLAAATDHENKLRCTLLAEQILVERDKRNLTGPALSKEKEMEAIKAERSRLVEKSVDTLAEVLSEIRILPIPTPAPPMGRGNTTSPTQEERASVLRAADVATEQSGPEKRDAQMTDLRAAWPSK